VKTRKQEIANLVRKRIFSNSVPVMAVLHSYDEPAFNATTSNGYNRRKKKCILLALAVLIIAAAIGAGLGIPLSKKPPPPKRPDPLDAFPDVVGSVSEEGLDDPRDRQRGSSKYDGWHY
jgi:hypothetical protein